MYTYNIFTDEYYCTIFGSHLLLINIFSQNISVTSYCIKNLTLLIDIKCIRNTKSNVVK